MLTEDKEANMANLAARQIRRTFGKIADRTPLPNLIEVQKRSYESFLQLNVAPENRHKIGLQGVFSQVFPVNDFAGRAQIEFIAYNFSTPKYDVSECVQRGLTFSAPLRLTLRLIVWDVDEDSRAKSIHDIKEQDVYIGDVPLMTKDGTFIVNGTERVVVSQMHRSPGVFFDHDSGKSHASGKLLFSSRVIPYRGSWLDFEFDAKDLLNVRIDRRRKILATTFLMALYSATTEKRLAELEKNGKALPANDADGMGREEILSTFYDITTYERIKQGWRAPFIPEKWRGIKITRPLVDSTTKKEFVAAGVKITPRLVKQLQTEGERMLLLPSEEILGHYLALRIVDQDTGEVIAEAGDEVTENLLIKIDALGLKKVDLLAIDNVSVGGYIRDTLAADKNTNREEALIDIYRIMRPGEPPTLESAEALFTSLFFDEDRYDLSPVGRVKMNARLNLDKRSDDFGILAKEDILEIMKTLVELKDGRGDVDDIDHLGNRRVRSVGELLENQYRIGLLRMERAIRERMSSVDIETVMPHDLINAKPAAAAIRDFFNSSQLSQFMDQTNPLSEITHKRRLSALGPGGLTRDRAGFEVRDVHPTHYGRICPIETPEGPNIGLINSLAAYARINKYGFIESPYRCVENGKIVGDVVYLSAIEEGRCAVAQSDTPVDNKGNLMGEFAICRLKGEFVKTSIDQVSYIDVSPKQLVSVATSLIPFLENDDANRALMGSNMQRQAVPLIHTDSPLVGTGMEPVVARDSGVVVIAKRAGVVDQVDANRIVIRTDEEGADVGVDIYNLSKFQRSNMGTCINQKPLVRVGDTIEKNQVIGDGPSTDKGDLALGQNALVAFMSWNGRVFEDSIMISERIVQNDVFTSIHISEFEVMSRDTKLGNEEITRDIPNVGEEALRNLDEAGIISIGAEVKPGDILAGKVTPKGETPMTPEEKLLRAIFGEKATDVRDTSLRVPPGTFGTVVDVHVFSRRGVEKDERALSIEQANIESLRQDCASERKIIERNYYLTVRELIEGTTVVKGTKVVKKGTKLTAQALDECPRSQWAQFVVDDDKAMDRLIKLTKQFDQRIKAMTVHLDDKISKVQSGDELSPGVMKMVKVFIAVKRKLQPGDKMAGRHGNKGVISCIVPVEDMPHLEDGTPVDVVLNPLGIPSRMNVGQVLETHLGWASAGFGAQIGEMLDKVRDGLASDQALRETIESAYPGTVNKNEIEQPLQENVQELAENMRRGVPIATPVFDGASVEDVTLALKNAGLSESGQVWLRDGQTGETFERPVTVGYMYMLKLHHLVDDKIHARSIGPYSLVTQQPLGGKAQFGGQRFGEMEVWALEAYGAAYTLQEMLTVKSDDVTGRTKVYESIIRGDGSFEVGIPESFNVLVKEIKSLGLNVEFREDN